MLSNLYFIRHEFKTRSASKLSDNVSMRQQLLGGGNDDYVTTNNAKDFYNHFANAIIRDDQLTLFWK